MKIFAGKPFPFFVAWVGLLLLGAFRPGGAEELEDLQKISQRPFHYISVDWNKPLVPWEVQKEKYQIFRERYFAPWNSPANFRKKDVEWPFWWLMEGLFYGENLQLRPSDWLEKELEKTRPERLGELSLPGITLQETDLRLFPTNKPAFRSFAKAGEGYPFDYLQNSTLKPFEPVCISHASADGGWFFVRGGFASGWVDARHLAVVDQDFRERWQNLPLGVTIRDNTSIVNSQGQFLGYAKVGTLFPLLQTFFEASSSIIAGVSRNEHGMGVFQECVVSADALSPMPMRCTEWNAMMLLEEFLGEPYGWGGSLQNRDCSATVRDFFIPFGLWLPRNSRYQAEAGRVLSLKKVLPENREALLLEKGKPFQTLVGLPGHVMLYVGAPKGVPVVFHNTWGIKTLVHGEEGRYVIGKALFTSLHVGENLGCRYPGKTLLIHRITTFSFPWE